MRCRGELAASGIDYPDEWRPDGVDNHHEIFDLVGGRGPNPRLELQRLLDYLVARGDKAILLSSESLTYRLRHAERGALLDFLAAVRAVRPVTCIWTLREASDFISSMYLRLVQNGRDVPPPEQFMRRFAEDPRGWQEIFEGLGRVEDVVDDVVYLGYRPDGSHNDALLSAIGAPAPVLSALHEDPRLNARLTHKAAVAMIHVDEISRRTGVPVTRGELRDLFYREEFRFAGDGPCTLVDAALTRMRREQALAAAASCGFAPYMDLCGDPPTENASPVDITPEILAGEDLERLVEHLEAPARRSLQ